MRRIRAIIYGVGEMGRMTARLLNEKNVEIVGAIGNKSNLGRDLGEIAEIGYPLNVIITNDADAVLRKTKADIAVLTVGSHMSEMIPHFKRCLESGLNIVTIAEDAFYPERFYPEMTMELDNLAKAHGVTLTAVGIQDVYWLNLLTVLSGASHKIESVLGQAISNVDDYGPLAAESISVGASEKEFCQIRKGDENISFFGMALEAIIADLGMELAERKEWITPMLGTEDIRSVSLGKTIRKGLVIGQTHITEIVTKDGVKFRSEFIEKIFREGETEASRWMIRGIPDLYLENPKLPGPLATCAATVNRIPDVINSRPGFVTVDKLPKPKFKPLSFEHYLTCQAEEV